MENETLVNCILTLKKKCDFELKIADAFGITQSELHCLVAFDPGTAFAAHALCEKMGLSKSRGSRVITSLGSKGFVRIKADPSDKRFQQLTLTASGMECVRRIREEKEKCDRLLKAALRPEGYKKAKKTVIALINAI